MYAFAKLGKTQLDTIQQFEQETGVRLLALQQDQTAPAEIPQQTLDSLKNLEEELGLCLVAVQ